MMGSPASIAIFPNQGQPPEPHEAEGESGIEKRNAPRYPAALVPGITSLRMSPHGAEATLVNISTTGLLAECAVRLKTGSTVIVQFEGTFTPATAQGRVARCTVSRVSGTGTLIYHVALAFAAPIPLPEELERMAAAFDAPAPAALPQTAARAETENPAPVAAPAPSAEDERPAVRNRW
jgi:hypothetical protein